MAYSAVCRSPGMRIGSYHRKSSVSPSIPLDRDQLVLPCLGTREEAPPPFDIHGLDVPYGRDQVGGLALRSTKSAPHSDVVLGGRLLAVFNLGYLRAAQTGKGSEPPAGQPSITANITQAPAQRLARLVDGVRSHDRRSRCSCTGRGGSQRAKARREPGCIARRSRDPPSRRHPRKFRRA